MKDTISGLLMLAISAAVWHSAGALPAGNGAGLGPGDFPRGVAALVGVLSLILAVRGAARGGAAGSLPAFGPRAGRALVFFAFIGAYLPLMPLVGYVLSTSAFLLASFALLSPRRAVRDLAAGAVFSVAAAVCVFWLFGCFLKVPLIEGPVDEFLRYTIMKGIGIA